MPNIDELWPGGPKYMQRPGVFKLGSDSVLLAAFAKLARVKTVCDLGSGGGVLPILLQAYKPGMKITGLEIEPAAVQLSCENVELNGMTENINIIHGDMREYKTHLEAGKFDLVVSNPPYFAAGSGYESDTLPTARGEAECSLEDVCRAAAYAVRWGGSFAIVHRPERLSELCCTLTACGLEPKRLRMTQYKNGAAPNLVLIEARRGGKPGLVIEPPLIMTDESGGESEEIRRIYRRGEQ